MNNAGQIVAAILAAGVCGGVCAGQVVGGFDTSRGGAFSFTESAYAAGARSALSTHFSPTFTSASVLTPEFLGGLDVLIITSASQNNAAITPLSGDEQAALGAFLAGGGRAILIPDNDTFSGAASAANASILSAVGMSAAGTLSGTQTANLSPLDSPLASGPFGDVTTFTTLFPGWISNTGAGQVVARHAANNQVAAAVLDNGALGAGSGRVVVFTDTAAMDFTFANNDTVFLNAFAWVVVPTPGGAGLLACGVLLAARRRRG